MITPKDKLKFESLYGDIYGGEYPDDCETPSEAAADIVVTFDDICNEICQGFNGGFNPPPTKTEIGCAARWLELSEKEKLSWALEYAKGWD